MKRPDSRRESHRSESVNPDAYDPTPYGHAAHRASALLMDSRNLKSSGNLLSALHKAQDAFALLGRLPHDGPDIRASLSLQIVRTVASLREDLGELEGAAAVYEEVWCPSTRWSGSHRHLLAGRS